MESQSSFSLTPFPMGSPSPEELRGTPIRNPSLGLTGGLLSSIRSFLSSMTGDLNYTCLYNCSGRGECLEGTCVCQVQYHGASCTDPNLAYFVSFASIFYLIGFVSFIQLLVCVRFEYIRMKTPNLRKACTVTTQKMLYVITFVASVLRGAYFSSPSHADLPLSSSFMSAFYPIILTAGSLIVCFWAEAFHLRDIRCERPRFLSKSFCGFLTFNAITYSLFLAEVILTKETSTEEERSFLAHVFNGCYAVLLFIVVVFFLIYGVEVYFKVRGGFVSDTIIVGNVQSRSQPSNETLLTVNSLAPSSTMPSSSSSSGTNERSYSQDEKENESFQNLLGKEKVPDHAILLNNDITALIPKRGIDQSQLHQSRFGLVFQACMLMITVCFLCSDVLGGFWKNKVPLMSRNAYDIIFRVVELAVALWFPCVLWNCISPEQLWILNPKKILKKLDFEKTLELGEAIGSKGSATDLLGECWICYDTDTLTNGPMIHPCYCKGDVGAVHHNCLRKWLMECTPADSRENLSCKVCGAIYQLERKNIWWIGKGFTAKQWLTTASIVTVMCGTIAAFWSAMELCDDAFKRALAAGGMLIVLYICLRLLGFNVFTGYQRAKISAARILGGRFATPSQSTPTPSVSTVRIDEDHEQNADRIVYSSSAFGTLPPMPQTNI